MHWCLITVAIVGIDIHNLLYVISISETYFTQTLHKKEIITQHNGITYCAVLEFY